ncbi:hypothetical protein N431DRAFT_520187 [Stipitochalara longipes BDJ]|nr:hypothetical protein N431DRAFT_520187 [Stipitochalara longipes BDJ]
MARGGNGKGGGRGGNGQAARGGGPPNGGRQGGGNKHCNICNKNGHNSADCYQNPDRKPNNDNGKCKGNGQQNTTSQGQVQGGKWCSNCNMKNHNTEDCSRGPKSSGQSRPQAQIQNHPQYPNQGYGGQQQPQIPDINGVPIVFNDPCQLCTQHGHIARDCPSRHTYIPPQAGSYFPQTYPPPSNVPIYTPPQQQWQQWQGPEMVGEEVSTHYQQQQQQNGNMQEPIQNGYQGYLGYNCEVAVQREGNRDRDGDFVMEDMWY